MTLPCGLQMCTLRTNENGGFLIDEFACQIQQTITALLQRLTISINSYLPLNGNYAYFGNIL